MCFRDRLTHTHSIVTKQYNQQVKRAYDKPIEILNQIGATLPKPAAFFINFIIIKALTGLPSELMRVMSYLQHLVKIVFVCVLPLSFG